MPFKIVQTIERGETCLTVVPSGWEKSGTLHWPKKNAVAKLSLEEFSMPSPKWERIDCVKKREFKTRAEAENEVDRMESVSDTEADDVPSGSAGGGTVRSLSTNWCCGVFIDFNCWVVGKSPFIMLKKFCLIFRLNVPLVFTFLSLLLCGYIFFFILWQ